MPSYNGKLAGHNVFGEVCQHATQPDHGFFQYDYLKSSSRHFDVRHEQQSL